VWLSVKQKNSKRQMPNPKEISNGLGDEDGAKVEGFNIRFFLAFGPWRL
jgi:hypothetical protein